jgi:hypothetical protein
MKEPEIPAWGADIDLENLDRKGLLAYIERLREDCAEAYQAVGNLGEHFLDKDGNYNYKIIKLMDNLSAAADGYANRPHEDVLPFYINEEADSVEEISTFEPYDKIWIEAEINEIGINKGQKIVGVIITDTTNSNKPISNCMSVPVNAIKLRI